MVDYSDYFKHIDFEKDWTEEDWERFFKAQDRMMESFFKKPSGRRSGQASDAASDLAFRKVLESFGMSPEEPSPPLPPRRGAPGEPPARRSFWEEEAEVESLPLFVQAQDYAVFIQNLVTGPFRGHLRKSYKSERHRRFQIILRRLRFHSYEIPRGVAAGHAVGYGPGEIVGNIVRCRRALWHADACLGLLSRMPRVGLNLAEFKKIFGETARMRNSLLQWIAYLREHASRGGGL